MHYSVCIDAVFRNQPVQEAMKAVSEAGFRYYEFWGWWNKDLRELLEGQERYQLRPAALCTQFISLTDPSQRAPYLEELKKTMDFCARLGCPAIISQVGNDRKGVSREEQHQSIVDGLSRAAELLEGSGLTLVFEPLNTRIDHPGYYLWSSDEAFSIQEKVASPRIKVLYDIYHQYVMERPGAEAILSHLDQIGHFHVAGYPGRHEPLINCEFDYPAFFEKLSKTTYDGAVGMEYNPVYPAAEGVKELFGRL